MTVDLAVSLPDSGPWSFTRFRGELIAVSAQSGTYVVDGASLVPVMPDNACQPLMVTVPRQLFAWYPPSR